MDFQKIRQYAIDCHNRSNCEYDGQSYGTHLDMVTDVLKRYYYVFKFQEDRENTYAATPCHDLIEDAKQTYSDIKANSNKDVADIVLAVTDVPEENRLLRHLFTMAKTVKDHRAIVLKMCDMHANGSYSKEHGSSMYSKYVEEYSYRKPIFQKALTWYKKYINIEVLDLLWAELDEIHNTKKKGGMPMP